MWHNLRIEKAAEARLIIDTAPTIGMRDSFPPYSLIRSGEFTWELKYRELHISVLVLNMIYEWRVYDTCLGKLPALLERFRKGEMKLFEKHGMKIVGFWTNLVGGESGVLYYMVGYKDLADRERCWQGFSSDPEWQRMREESEKEGPLVCKVRNMLLTPTDFSPSS